MAQKGVGAPALGPDVKQTFQVAFWDPYRLNDARVLGASPGFTFYTSVARTWLDRIELTNIDASPRVFTIRWIQANALPAGAPLQGGNGLTNDKYANLYTPTVAAGDTLIIPAKKTLETGDTIVAFCDVAFMGLIYLMGGYER